MMVIPLLYILAAILVLLIFIFFSASRGKMGWIMFFFSAFAVLLVWTGVSLVITRADKDIVRTETYIASVAEENGYKTLLVVESNPSQVAEEIDAIMPKGTKVKVEYFGKDVALGIDWSVTGRWPFSRPRYTILQTE